MRNLKLLGVAVVAALAIGAVAAATALAGYHSEVTKTDYRGTQQTSFVFWTDLGGITCTTAKYSADAVTGTTKGPGDFTAHTLTLHPLFGAATGSGTCTLAGVKVTVETTGCDFELQTATSQEAIKAGTNLATVLILCDAGKEIVIKDTLGLKCEVKIPGQLPLDGIMMFTNLGTGANREIELESEIREVSYSWTATCPNAGKAAGGTATGHFQGNVRLKGLEAGTAKQVGVWVKLP